ncbi:MAG: adenylyl-sulfate kinase [Desulfovibrio sp.]
MGDNGGSKGSGWAVWITGLPGSGKSTLADALVQRLRAQGRDVLLLRMDERRKVYFPHPAYTPEEREAAYALFADEAAGLVAQGRGVILDGTAHLLRWRGLARERIPRFAEMYLRCSLETAMQREAARPEGLVMAGMYAKALERRRTGLPVAGLGEVVGVDTPFEPDPEAECVLDNDGSNREAALERALEFLRGWLPPAVGTFVNKGPE